jgi:hypothetical protein
MPTAAQMQVEKEQRIRATLIEAAAREDAGREGRKAERDERAAYVAARPERWAALSPLERALYLTAAAQPTTIRGALLRVAEMLGKPNGFPMVGSPPSNYESPDR